MVKRLLILFALVSAPAHAQINNPGVTAGDLPPTCATVPPTDTLTGSVGASTPCTPRTDRTAILDVQAGDTLLAANCTFSMTFARAFSNATPFVYAAVVDSGGAQMPCKVQSRSSTVVSGICNGAQSTVLNLSIVTTGLTLLPFGTTCTAGTPVMVIGRNATQ